MDTRQLAAIAGAVGIMVLWFMTLPTPDLTQPMTQTEEVRESTGVTDPMTQGSGVRHETGEAAVAEASEPIPGSAVPEGGAAPVGEEFVLENAVIRLRIDSFGGVLRSVELLEYNDRIGDSATPVELVTLPTRGIASLRIEGAGLEGAEDLPHEVLERSSRMLRVRRQHAGVELLREVEVDAEGYGAWLRTTLLNRTERGLQPRFVLQFYARDGAGRPGADPFQDYSAIASVAGEPERVVIRGIGTPGFLGGLFGATPGEPVQFASPVEWRGLDSRYFLVAALPEDAAKSTGSALPAGRDAGLLSLRYPAFEVPPGHKLERAYRLYLGPKTRDAVTGVDARLAVSLDVGWSLVRPLVQLFHVALRWTYQNVVANYGVAIILLTILLRLLTYPLTQKSMKSMKRFGEIAPEMKAIQENHAEDREKMQAELMSLYRQKGMNPFTAMGGGCLPMLIQMPFLLALYFALQGSIELRHAPFALWIQDLSTPENFVALFGLPIRPLPLMMGGSMILQQWLTPSTADAQQKQMMMWMSAVFTFMFYQFPSGLVLYWFVSNLLGILQQLLVNRGGGAPAPVAKSA